MTAQQKEEGLNKILFGAIIALLSWNIYTTHSLAIDVAVINSKVGNIERIINDNEISKLVP
jgi:hypothetical protein